MKTWIKAATVAFLAISLGACSKKSDKSNTVATTPAPVTTTVTTQSCANYTHNPLTQQYVDASGNAVTCTPINGGLPTGNGGGCSQWNQVYAQYGVTYYPVQVGGQLVCVRNDLLGQYIPGFNQNPYQYYNQQQPFYTCNWGYDSYCNTYSNGYNGNGGCVNFGGTSWGQQFSLNGQLGLCW